MKQHLSNKMTALSLRHIKFLTLITAFLFIFFLTKNLSAQDLQTEKWDIEIKTESLETILLNPEEILDDPDSFWKTDDAYVLVKGWHERNKISLDTKDYYNKWLKYIESNTNVPREDRKNHSAFSLLEDLKLREEIFYKQAIPLLNEFTPKNALRFKTIIHITTKTFPFAIMTNGQILSDVLSPYFKNDPDKIFNSLTHECYHIAYGFNRYLRKEVECENSFIYNTLLDALQNEGLATYVGYKAQDFFPVGEDRDYKMIDNPSEVYRHLHAVNDLFSVAESLSVDSLRKLAWKVGVDERSYYVAGAYMSGTIDNKLGRDALLETIAMGPLNFVSVYNELVDDSMKIYMFKAKGNTLFQELKKAAIADDQMGFKKISKEILAKKSDSEKRIENKLVKLGYGMIYQKKYEWAVSVFKLNIDLYPETANNYDCLAEAYLESGDKENAILYYKRALEVDPDFKNARKKLEELI